MSTLWYFELVGVIAAGWMFFDWTCESYYYIRALCARKDLDKYGRGSWALITGATDGIGLGFAQVLAKSGFNLVLISRNQDKLDRVADELKSHSINVLTIAKDFSKCPENPSEFFNSIDDKTRELDISILVNNVGTATPGYFHTQTPQELSTQNALNLWPIVYLSKIYLRRMLNRPKPSALINISSTGSILPCSGLTVYCAGKSFDHLFTLDLNEEIRYLVKQEKLQGVDILSYQPAFVETPLTSGFSKKPLVITPVQCAERGLSVLGKCNYSSGHWKSLIYSMFYRNVPWYINAKLTLGVIRKDFKRK
jgi:17beta-estradiol 17-dehydrogenase / very-long-chain 3-oxoacyl-CoA reductase